MIDALYEVWAMLGGAQEFLVAIVLSLVTAALISAFKARVKLTWGSTSSNFHKLHLHDSAHEPTFINTEKLFVQNAGKKPATDIELILSDAPSSYTLWSPREHTFGTLKDGGYAIKIPSLAPGELLIVDTVDVHLRNPQLIAVNSPDAITQQVSFHAVRQFGWIVNSLVAYLMFSGLVATVYLVLLFVSRSF